MYLGNKRDNLVQALEAASAVNSISSGVSDMATNGVTLGNAVETGMGVLTIVGLKATTCFTAGTQVVVDDKIRDIVYFTESTGTQAFDEVNILFAFAGISCAVASTTISLKKRNRNKPVSRKINQIQLDDGLLCEIDETEYQFSLRKWILLPLLIIATIICGYFALPTTRTIAVTKSVERVKSGYVTKNIEDIQIGDEVFAYDVTTGKVEKCKVTDTFERTSDHLRYLTVCDSKGTQIFETTDSHPFWVVTDKPDLSRTARETVEDNGTILRHENIEVTKNGYYVEAKDLKVGDTFIGASNEVSVLAATKREDFSEGITVYNFTVEDNHNYFVIANLEAYQNGASVVLVHNATYKKNSTADAERARSIANGIPENQIGPSGRSKRFFVQLPTMKTANDAAHAAAGKGGTVMHHPNPNVGRSHFHAVKRDGTKIRIHFEYPD